MESELSFERDLPELDFHDIDFAKSYIVAPGDTSTTPVGTTVMGFHLNPNAEDGGLKFTLSKYAFLKMIDFMGRNMHNLYTDPETESPSGS